MRFWAVYPITAHGMPIMPVFISKTKQRAIWYLEYQEEKWCWNPLSEYIIEPIYLDVPKIGVQRRTKKIVIQDEVLEIRRLSNNQN